jgi:hypothetical protein
MSLRSDHKALLFVGAVAVFGAGVRMVRAGGKDATPAVQPALDRQAAAAESAARVPHGQGRGAGAGRRGVGTVRDSAPRAQRDTSRRAIVSVGLLDRPGYMGRRLDLDVATAAQIDSLPGITPAFAKRIVADRMARGPFLNRDGLRRVIGVSPAFLARIDTLVTFTGTFARPSPSDTAIARARRARDTAPRTPTGTLKNKTPIRPAARRTMVRPRAPLLRAVVDSWSPVRGSAASPRRAR